jgi:hypothetical protein
MAFSSQAVAGVGVSDGEREAAAADCDQDDIEHLRTPAMG